MTLNNLLNDKPLGVLCAMPEEVAEYLKHFEDTTPEEVSGVKFYHGILGSQKVILAQCGVGKVHAAVSSQTMILKYGVGAIIFSGVAGALASDLEVGDMVISQDALQHDMDLVPLGFQPGEIPWTGWTEFACDPILIKSAKNAAEALKLPHKVGRAVSGDQFVADPERVKALKDYFKGDCVEMEAGAVGQVCMLNGGVPWITVRAISDKADHSSPVDFPSFCQEAAVKAYHLVVEMTR